MMGAVACQALAGAVQAVDGVAPKAMVNSWAAAHEPEKATLFQPAFGVRQIEIGFASITGLLSGLTLTIYGIAFLIGRRVSRWIGQSAMVGGAPLAVGGVVTAYTGFSGLSMNISLPAGFLITVWIIALGVCGSKEQKRGPRSLASMDASLTNPMGNSLPSWARLRGGIPRL